TERDRLWLAVSLFWGLGCENALFNLLTHGGCVVLQEHFEPKEALRLISAERCTLFYGTPNMAQALFDHPDRRNYDLTCLRAGGGRGAPNHIRRVIALGARESCNSWAPRETYANCCVTDAAEPLAIRCNSVGRPLPGVDIRIVDGNTGKSVPYGELGGIRVKVYVTIGCFKDNVKTRQTLDPHGHFMTRARGNLAARGRRP